MIGSQQAKASECEPTGASAHIDTTITPRQTRKEPFGAWSAGLSRLRSRRARLLILTAMDWAEARTQSFQFKNGGRVKIGLRLPSYKYGPFLTELACRCGRLTYAVLPIAATCITVSMWLPYRSNCLSRCCWILKPRRGVGVFQNRSWFEMPSKPHCAGRGRENGPTASTLFGI